MSETSTTELPIFVQCINAADKPYNADGDWLEEGCVYVATAIHPDLITGDLSFKLLDMCPGNGYETYRADRFIMGIKFSVN